MSLTIAIQACCQVFQISYADLVASEQVRYNHGYKSYSPLSTEKKFACYFMYYQATKREISAVMNLSDRIVYVYYLAIDELLKEQPENWEVIRRLEEKYNEIQSKRIKAA